MKAILLFLIAIGLSFISISQTTRKNWLVGGHGSFTESKVRDEKNHYLQLSPNIGYFFSNNLAVGVRPSYTYNKRVGSTFSGRSTGFNVGPFARFYFLNPEKQFNILLEGVYQYGLERGKGYTDYIQKHYLNTFSFAAGPVIYFNTSVGVEFLAGYTQSKYTDEDFHRSQFQIQIGLQVHLEKE